jgi:hypothetical protein
MTVQMERIGGKNYESFDINSVVWIEDLSYYDGPLLSLFRTKAGDIILFSWVDCDESANRWLVFEVSKDQLDAYLTGEIPLRTLMERPKHNSLCVLDLGDDANYATGKRITPDGIPTEYLPAIDSFY